MRGPLAKLRLALPCVALLLLGSAAATTYTLGAWSFRLPDGARESVENGVRAFGVGGAVYLFTPPEPLAGRSLEAVATATIADLTRGQNSTVRFVRRETVNGTVVLAYSGGVTDPSTGAGLVHASLFFEREGQWGLALLMVGADADTEEVMEPLGTVTFRTLKDNWLTLSFSGGRVQRLYVYGQPAAFLNDDPSRGQRLNIGGTWLGRVGGP